MYRFKYVSDGSDVEKGPWGSDDENTGEGYVQSKMNGEWNTVKSTKDNFALCQMPGKYTFSNSGINKVAMVKNALLPMSF